MTISETKRELREIAARSAVASVTMAGLRPSPFLESLLPGWIGGDTLLNEIHSTLLEVRHRIVSAGLVIDIGMHGAAVPRNKLGITEPSSLSRATADFTTFRLAELHTSPIRGGFDSAHLQEIHHHIFQDLYDWAGELRGIDATDLPAAHLERSLNRIFDRLAGQNYLKGYAPEEWARSASKYVYDLSVLQPFVTGNDIACREFAAELALRNNLVLRWNATLGISDPVIQLRLPEEAANIRRIIMLAMDASPSPQILVRGETLERGIERLMSLDKTGL